MLNWEEIRQMFWKKIGILLTQKNRNIQGKNKDLANSHESIHMKKYEFGHIQETKSVIFRRN